MVQTNKEKSSISCDKWRVLFNVFMSVVEILFCSLKHITDIWANSNNELFSDIYISYLPTF